MYSAYAGEDELRTSWRLLFIVGVLSLVGGVLVAALSFAPSARTVSGVLFLLGIVSIVFGVAAVVAGLLLRRRRRMALLLGIVVSAAGLAFAAFDIVSSLKLGGPITVIALPVVRLALNLALVRALFKAEPYLRPERS